MDRALTIFGWAWTGLAFVVNIVAIVGLFLGAGDFWGGLARVQEVYSPFNFINYFLELALFAPAIAAFWWRDRRRETR